MGSVGANAFGDVKILEGLDLLTRGRSLGSMRRVDLGEVGSIEASSSCDVMFLGTIASIETRALNVVSDVSFNR